MHPSPPTQPGAAAELARRIRARGPITFAEFMAVALYWPSGGYYASRDAFGSAGDFYTAPLTHPVFGALIARQLYQMWSIMERPAPFWVLEPGAGNGRLAADIAGHAAALSSHFSNTLRYVAIDIRRPVSGSGFEWVRSGGLPFGRLRGVVLANELLDAFPVHRVVRQGGRLREIYVDIADAPEVPGPAAPLRPPRAAFKEVPGEPSTPALEERFAGLGIGLPEGYRTEVCLGVDAWLADAASALDAGYVLLIDYGHEAPEYYAPGRNRGTLRCHYRHTSSSDPYTHVGGQDIGAHVEFTSVRRSAEARGFETAGLTTQAEFLGNLGLDPYQADLRDRPDVAPAVRAANLRAIQTLVDGQGMGAFKVLALRKGVPPVPLAGFGGAASGLPSARPPLATPAHMPMGGAPEPPALPSWEELLR